MARSFNKLISLLESVDTVQKEVSEDPIINSPIVNTQEMGTVVSDAVPFNPSDYEWEGEVALNGVEYYVFANFEYEEGSVDYQFDPRRGHSGQGRDSLADLPFQTTNMKAFVYGPGDKEEEVTDPKILEALSSEVVKLARGNSNYTKFKGHGSWM